MPAHDELSPALNRLLYPRSIAILGASDNPRKLGGRPLDYRKRFGFAGRLDHLPELADGGFVSAEAASGLTEPVPPAAR